MRLRYFAACVLGAAACAGVPSLAYSAPFSVNMFNGGADATRIRFLYSYANAYACNDQQTCVSFAAQAYDDADGVWKGYVAYSSYNANSGAYSRIECVGTQYVNSISVNAGNGNTVLSATLDPWAPGCVSEYISAPIVVSLSAQANGAQSQTQTGVSTMADASGTYKQNFTNNTYSTTSYGAIGSQSGPFEGISYGSKTTSRQRIK